MAADPTTSAGVGTTTDPMTPSSVMPGSVTPDSTLSDSVTPGCTLSGLGIDLVEVSEIRTALGRRPGLRSRLFTDSEWDYAHRHRDPMPHLAARFAAKEAVMKSLGGGIGSMSFNEIEVGHRDSGAPMIRLAGRAAGRASAQGVRRFEVSLTHTKTMAQATVAALS